MFSTSWQAGANWIEVLHDLAPCSVRSRTALTRMKLSAHLPGLAPLQLQRSFQVALESYDEAFAMWALYLVSSCIVARM